MDYLAHIDEEKQKVQSMLEHAQGTAKKAAEFGEAFSVGELGCFCGMLHDIGKYSEAFQRRIRGSSEKVDHATAGAKVAMEEFRNIPAAFCIAGHHAGLPDRGKKLDTPDSPTFCGKLSRTVGRDIADFSAFRSEISVITPPAIPEQFLTNIQSQTFFIRMLYSCLVDADYLDTEACMTQEKVKRGNEITFSQLEEKLAQYIAPWWDAQSDLNRKRCEILKTCMETGNEGRGLFTLTVPTGGGKTVSSMAFALQHAQVNKVRRVIYVIPYTSIIEQTQAVFENIFGKENVVAHYANVEYLTDENASIEERKPYIATENWDAPIILTTSVQFFESLYANRSTRCRKLHNIANSVIVFDEAQMLPVPYLKPCITAISQLVLNYTCSAVLCTATQPALNRLFQKQLPNMKIREICPKVSELHDFFQRVTFRRRGKLSDEELADHLQKETQVLCIVNSRQQAQSVYAMLEGEGCYHLSTTMYPTHRRAVLDEVRWRLDQKLPCRVVSTSLVEAGVDVDFPAVYRALAGLDSMIQAAGRCNRENKRTRAESIVSIFETDQKSPRMIEQNISSAERVMRNFDDISTPEAVKEYFEFLYYTLKDEKQLDQKQILEEIESGSLPFATVAEKFHMIEGAECIVYIPLEEGESLIRQLKEYGPSRSLIRKLGQYAVNVYSKQFQELLRLGAIEKMGENSAVLCDLTLYQKETGFVLHPNEGREWIV